MIGRAASNSRSQRGQSMVELSLILPIVALITLVCLDLGRAYFVYVGALGAAEHGARYVAVHPSKSDAEVAAIAITEPSGSMNIAGGNVAVSGTRSPGNEITVAVTMPFTPVTPFVSNLVQSWTGTPTISIQVTATTVVL